MSKLLNDVLDKISENNNDYRNYTEELNKNIEEKTTALVGDVVTFSNYIVDFSNAIVAGTEKLFNPISKSFENFVIKDLRNVENVNEQFLDKINQKIESADITNDDDKNNFITNLNSLLNDKYLDIVKIKRVSYIDQNGVNVDVEKAITEFLLYITETFKVNAENLTDLINKFRSDIYLLIDNCLKDISDLYLNNFIDAIVTSLNGEVESELEKDEPFVPFVPNIPDIPIIEDVNNNILEKENITNNIKLDDETNDTLANNEELNNIPVINSPEENENTVISNYDYNADVIEDTKMDIPEVKPIVAPIENEPIKKTYDVEEILKIAKSPIVTMPDVKKDDSYSKIETIVKEEENDTVDTDFDEQEIVEEMLNRLNHRLNEIIDRKQKYEEEKEKLEEDEKFVNDLIINANNKKDELDLFEKELDEKEESIKQKQLDLDKKLNEILPFANAIMKDEKEA